MTTLTPKLNILVSGAGIAGPALAYFLGIKAGHSITLVERFGQLNTKGQNIDLRGPGQQVVKMMGVEQRVREMTTTEEGTVFENADGAVQAKFEKAAEGSGGLGFTSDIEILRGDLAEVLYRSTKNCENVKYIFGDHITHVEQANNKVYVDFASGTTGQQFDLLVAADGQGSSVREQVFGKLPGCKGEDITNHTGLYIAYFTVPQQDDDTRYWRIYNAPCRRAMSLRPDPHGSVRSTLDVIPTSPELQSELDAALSQRDGISAQRSILRRIFVDAGWKSARLLDAMDQAEDFYMQSVIQIKMPHWSSERVVLLGDAAYTPSPITGMGTTLALCGAYVLAGELASRPSDLSMALEEYERKFRPFVETKQKLVPGAPHVAHPDTWWGIKVFHWVLWAFSASGVVDLIFRFVQTKGEEEFKLPAYSWKAEE